MWVNQTNGCAERMIRTLKEQLLWVQSFPNLEELNQALEDFREKYNSQWLIQRHGYLTPKEARERAESCARQAA